MPLAEITGLVNGVAGLRIAADAVLDLWQRDDSRPTATAPPRARSCCCGQRATSSAGTTSWPRSIAGDGPAPRPRRPTSPPTIGWSTRSARDLAAATTAATSTAVRVIWTADHLDAARRLEVTLVGPARAAAG